MDSPLLDKSLDFATKIVLFYETFSKTRKDTFNELLELADEIRVGKAYPNQILG